MKKSSQFAIAAVAAIGLSLGLASSTSALEITIGQTGTVRFYQDEVLGKNSQNAAAEKALPRQAQPIRTMSIQEDKNILVRAGKQDAQIELKSKSAQDSGQSLSQSEQLSDKQIEIEFPAGNNDQAEATQEQSVYLEHIRQERQKRSEEMIQIRNKNKNQEKVLELQSRRAKASLQQGAEFKLDPENNQITVITPSGQEHLLNHLPDQVVDRMNQRGLYPDDELEIETNDEGETIYQTKAIQKRRLFGLFPREIALDVELNDTTGEIEASLAQDSSFLEQVLDSLSF